MTHKIRSDDNLTHVVRAADKLAQRMGGRFVPDPRVASKTDSGAFEHRTEMLPLSR